MVGTSSSNGTNGQTKVLFAAALVTSLLWYFYWVVMASVERDISDIINWYFFMKLKFRHMYDVYGALATVHYYCPLVVILLYLLSKISVAYRCFFTRLSQIVFLVVIAYNILMLIFLLFVGHKIAMLFLLTLPIWTMITAGSYLSFIFATQHLFLASLPFLLLYFCFFCHFKFKRRPSEHSTIVKGCWEPSLRAAAKRLSLIFVVPVCLSIFVGLVMRKGCNPCFVNGELRLPKRPGLVGHRGCDDMAPENSMAAFEEAASIPEIIGFETDVMISMDGVPFLLHDPHLVRTTDVETKCPTLDPFMNASLLYYFNGSCPLMELNVGRWFVKNQEQSSGLMGAAALTRSRLETYSRQLLPDLRQFLELAEKRGKVVLFDLREPPVGHAYHKSYINVTLSSIVASGISLNKVWWLTKDRRRWVYNNYPRMVQVTKTQETKFEEFKDERIQRINDDWSTPLEVFRKYQDANITLGMYFVDSPLMYSYAWCLGVQSVTTSHCKLLSSQATNPLYDICHFWHRELTPSYMWLVCGIGLFLLEILLLGFWECLRVSRTGSPR